MSKIKKRPARSPQRFANFAQYERQLTPAQRVALRRVRTAIARAAPEAQETISYNMPAFRAQNGALLYYAAFAKHIGLFPPLRGNPRLQKAAAKFAGAKGNLRFEYKGDIPFDLIERIAAWRLGGE